MALKGLTTRANAPMCPALDNTWHYSVMTKSTHCLHFPFHCAHLHFNTQRRLYSLLLGDDDLSLRALSVQELFLHALVVAWLVSNKHLREPVALPCSFDAKVGAH